MVVYKNSKIPTQLGVHRIIPFDNVKRRQEVLQSLEESSETSTLELLWKLLQLRKLSSSSDFRMNLEVVNHKLLTAPFSSDITP